MKNHLQMRPESLTTRSNIFRRRWVAGAIAGTAFNLFAPANASASPAESSPTADVKHSPATAVCLEACLEPSRGNEIKIKIDLGKRYTEITQLCLTSYFDQDLLNPGEEYQISGLGGAVNIGDSDLTERQTCAQAGNNDDFISKFLDSKDTAELFMANGSVQVERVEVSVVGTPKQ